MEKYIKIFINIVFIFFVFIFSGYSQIIISAGGNGYLGSTGLMPGGGIAVEYWFSQSEQRSKSGIITGFGVEYIAVN